MSRDKGTIMDIRKQETWTPKYQSLYGSSQNIADDNGSCLGYSSNILHLQKWFRLDCSRVIANVNFLCEIKLNDSLLPRKEFETNILVRADAECPILYIMIENSLCISLDQTHSELSLVPNNQYMALKLSVYLTAWTYYHYSSTPLATIQLYRPPGEQINCTCFQTLSLFFQEVKEWFLDQCDCEQVHVLYFANIKKLLVKCKFNQHSCDDGTCIAEVSVCDGHDDCLTGEDEQYCAHVCTNTSANCFINCQIDEGCACHDHYYQCEIGGCIAVSQICNGIANCQNSDDERSCESVQIYIETHKEQSYPCAYGWALCRALVNDCFPIHKKCVFERDIYGSSLYCESTEHIMYCKDHKCTPNYKCHNSYCLTSKIRLIVNNVHVLVY